MMTCLQNLRRLSIGAAMLVALVSCVANAQTIVTPVDVEARGLESVINEVPVGGILILGSGEYSANAVVSQPILIVAEAEAVLRPEDPSVAVLTIRDTEDVLICGLTVEEASRGIEVLNSSCTIARCLINSFDIGIEVLSPGPHVAAIQDCAIAGKGIGIEVVGAGTAVVTDCEIRVSGTGIMVAGLASLVANHCSISRCLDGIVAATSADVLLYANTITENLSTGIRLASVPPELKDLARGILSAVDNTIAENVNWGGHLYDLRRDDLPVSSHAGGRLREQVRWKRYRIHLPR